MTLEVQLTHPLSEGGGGCLSRRRPRTGTWVSGTSLTSGAVRAIGGMTAAYNPAVALIDGPAHHDRAHRPWRMGRRAEAPAHPGLTRQQAQALRAELPSIPGRWLRRRPWRVWRSPLGAPVFGGRGGLFWSALYGAASWRLGAAGARGCQGFRRRAPAAAAVGFMVWEGVKVVLSVAMLVAAARVVPI